MRRWNTTPLARVAKIERASVQPEDISAGTMYVGLEHIESSGSFTDPKPVDSGQLASSKFRFSSNHVLYGKLRPYLAKIACPEFDGICSTDILPILPGPALDKRYLLHFLRQPSMVEYANARTTGINLPRLNPSTLEEFQIPLPPLEEQRRVVEILDKAGALRAKRRASLGQLDCLAQSVFIDLYGDPNANPNDFRVEPLGQFLSFVTSGSRGWAEHYSAHGSRFIRSLDVQMNHISNEEVVFVVPPDNAEARRTKVNAGDVLLTITGSRIGRVAPVPEELDGSFISQHVAILRVNPDLLDPDFLSFFLSLEVAGQRQIKKFQYGQTKPGLNFDQIRMFQILVPPVQLQREFKRRIAATKTLKAMRIASLAQIDELFASLQARAFRGEL